MKPMETYDVLREAFQFFNKELFSDKLSDCLILLQADLKPSHYT